MKPFERTGIGAVRAAGADHSAWEKRHTGRLQKNGMQNVRRSAAWKFYEGWKARKAAGVGGWTALCRAEAFRALEL